MKRWKRKKGLLDNFMMRMKECRERTGRQNWIFLTVVQEEEDEETKKTTQGIRDFGKILVMGTPTLLLPCI